MVATLKKLITSKNHISQYFPLELKEYFPGRYFLVITTTGISRPTLKWRHKVTTCGKNNINIWLQVIILILIGQLRHIFKSKQPRSSSVFGCSVNWSDWNVTIIFRFFPKMFEMTTKKVFHADDKYVLRLLNVVIHEHQFKRKGKYYKFHFDKEAYTKPKNVRIFMF